MQQGVYAVARLKLVARLSISANSSFQKRDQGSQPLVVLTLSPDTAKFILPRAKKRSSAGLSLYLYTGAAQFCQSVSYVDVAVIRFRAVGFPKRSILLRSMLESKLEKNRAERT